MINDYRNAMNRIKADDEFKEQLLKRLAAEQEKAEKGCKTYTSGGVKTLASCCIACICCGACPALFIPPRCWYCRC